MFKTLKMIAKYSRMKKEDDKRRRRYLKLSREELEALFKRFYRGDPARSRDGSFGLGLSIAENIVSSHSGKLWAESREGRLYFLAELPCNEEK